MNLWTFATCVYKMSAVYVCPACEQSVPGGNVAYTFSVTLQPLSLLFLSTDSSAHVPRHRTLVKEQELEGVRLYLHERREQAARGWVYAPTASIRFEPVVGFRLCMGTTRHVCANERDAESAEREFLA